MLLLEFRRVVPELFETYMRFDACTALLMEDACREKIYRRFRKFDEHVKFDGESFWVDDYVLTEETKEFISLFPCVYHITENKWYDLYYRGDHICQISFKLNLDTLDCGYIVTSRKLPETINSNSDVGVSISKITIWRRLQNMLFCAARIMRMRNYSDFKNAKSEYLKLKKEGWAIFPAKNNACPRCNAKINELTHDNLHIKVDRYVYKCENCGAFFVYKPQIMRKE